MLQDSQVRPGRYDTYTTVWGPSNGHRVDERTWFQGTAWLVYWTLNGMSVLVSEHASKSEAVAAARKAGKER